MKTIFLDACPSTQDYLRGNLQSLQAHFPVNAYAGSQSSGRGRDQRNWHSPAGLGLYTSFAFELNNLDMLSWVPLAAGMATAETLEKICRCKLFVKWPNDIVLNKKKLAGILSESIIQKDHAVCICGMGINLNMTASDFPENIRDNAVSLKLITGRYHDPHEINQHLEKKFSVYLSLVARRKKQRLYTKMVEYSSYMQGKTITFHHQNEVVKGKFLCVTPDGGLRIEKSDGRQSVFYSGEISDSP